MMSLNPKLMVLWGFRVQGLGFKEVQPRARVVRHPWSNRVLETAIYEGDLWNLFDV